MTTPTRREWDGKERRDARLRFTRWGDLLTLLVILTGFITMFITISNSYQQHKLSQKISHNQECIVDLQKLDADHASELFAIGSDDRRAVDNYITRVSMDVAINTKASIADIPKAYDVYRLERIANDERRAQLGSGIQISDACQYAIKPGKSPTVLPTLPTPTPTPSPTGTKSPKAGAVAPPSSTPNLTATPSAIIIGPTHTVFATVTATATVVRTTVVPGPKVRVTVTATKPALPSPLCLRQWPLPPPLCP